MTQLELLESVSSIARIGLVLLMLFDRFARYGMFFSGPGAKVDQLAALGAERAPRILSGPFDGTIAGRAGNGRHKSKPRAGC